LVAILALDAANFSKLVAEDEEGTLRLLADYRRLIDGAIATHGGRIVMTAGDSVLAEFASSVQAVRAAIVIQQALRDHNAALGLAQPMRFRIGVNIGDVVVDGDNILGDGVNVAVRLESLTHPDGICISATVLEHVAGKLDARFQDLGTQYLKNIPRPIRAYQVIPQLAGPETFMQRARHASYRVAWGAAAAAVLIGGGVWYAITQTAKEPRIESASERVISPEEREHWENVKNSTNGAELHTYISKYPRGAFAELALARLDGLAVADKRAADERAATANALQAQHAQEEARRLKAEAEASVEHAAKEQANAARLKVEAEMAANRAQAARAAAEAQQKLARTQQAAPEAMPPVTFIRAVSPHDGRWTSNFACETSAEQPASQLRIPAQIQFREVLIEAGTVGIPGYFRAYGSISEDGVFQIQGTSLPRTQRIVGAEDAMHMTGRVDGDQIHGAGTIGKRRCAVVLTRVAAQ
jgi:class 3 adenylate cyclase